MTSLGLNPRHENLKKSLLNVFYFPVDFCIEYSYTHNGPCMNGGVLVSRSSTLAMEAKCSCEKGFYGDFCDTVSMVCFVTQF